MAQYNLLSHALFSAWLFPTLSQSSQSCDPELFLSSCAHGFIQRELGEIQREAGQDTALSATLPHVCLSSAVPVFESAHTCMTVCVCVCVYVSAQL